MLGALAVAGAAPDPAPGPAEKKGGWELRAQLKAKALAGVVNSRWRLVFAPDGKTLAAATFSDQGDAAPVVRLWDLGGARPALRHTLTGHRKTGLALVAFTSDSGKLVSVGDDGLARIWDVANGKALGAFAVGRKDDAKAVEATWLRADNLLVVVPPLQVGGPFGDARPLPTRVELWDPQTGKPKGAARLPPILTGLALSPDGKTLVTGSDAEGERLGAVGMNVSLQRFWNLQTGKQTGLLKLPGVTRALFSPAGDRVLFQQVNPASDQPRLAFWNLADRKGHVPNAAALRNSFAHGFSGNGHYLVTASADKKRITVWDVGTEKAVGALPALEAEALAAALSADGQTLAVVPDAFDNTIDIWTYKGP
jgi:WD40 repeat protein